MSAAVLKPMNADERRRRARCESYGCVACVLGGNGNCGALEYHHLIVAGERAGHRFAIMLGRWHHQAVPLPGRNGVLMKVVYGPSLKFHAKEFHETYGSDQSLLDYTNDLIGEPRVILPTRRRSRGSAASPANIFPRGGLK